MSPARTFAEFWPTYLGEHAKPLTRRLHFVGTSLVIATVAAAAAFRAPAWLLLTPAAGYGFAWVGHFGVEKNRPATFRHPLWSLVADFKMWGLMLAGRLEPSLRAAGVPVQRAR